MYASDQLTVGDVKPNGQPTRLEATASGASAAGDDDRRGVDKDGRLRANMRRVAVRVEADEPREARENATCVVLLGTENLDLTYGTYGHQCLTHLGGRRIGWELTGGNVLEAEDQSAFN